MSDETKTIDPESISLEELRTAANLELARDDKGRFVAKTDEPEPSAETPTEPDEPEAVIYRTEIDLGDGSGAQVYEANSPEELTEKLVEAQKNATKKIRQQEAELKELRSKTAEKVKPAEITTDQEYVWSQEIVKNPAKVVREIVKTVTGRELEDLKTLGDRLDQEAEVRQRLQATEVFLASHEDFINDNMVDGKPNPNGDLMRMKLAEMRLPATSENLHKAYLQLKQSGLLKLKGGDVNADTEPRTEATERIAQPRTEVTQTRTRRTSSGISSHGRPAPQPAGFSEADAYSMPMDKLREKANAALQGR